MNTINWLDMALAIACLVLMLLGAWSGLVRSLFHIAAWLIGLTGAWTSGNTLAPWLASNIAGIPPVGLKVLAWILGFLIFFLLIRIVGNRLHKWVSGSPLNSVNRLGGAAIGLAKGLILTVAILLVLSILPLQGDLKKSRDDSLAWQFFDVYVHPSIPL